MSAFSGKQVKGAMKIHRELKKKEAEERNAKTPPQRRRQYRRDNATKLLTDIFAKES